MRFRKLQLQPSTLYTLLPLLQCFILLLPSVGASCKEHVKKYCNNMACQQGLMTKRLDMHDACKRLRLEITDICDEDCQMAITHLLNSYNGSYGLFTCNCTDTDAFYGQEDCELDRLRLSSCPPLVALFPVDDTVDQSSPCIAASQDCEADATCKARLDAYLQSCNPEQTDPETMPCSDECMGALEALYDQPLASNFWECSCEDTPDDWCRTSPLEYYELCQGHIANLSSPEVPYKPLNTKPTSPPTKVEEQNQEQSSANNSKENGNSAPTINTQAIYQIGLIVSMFWVLHHI